MRRTKSRVRPLATASYGHFGREPYALAGATAFSWERTDRAEALKAALT